MAVWATVVCGCGVCAGYAASYPGVSVLCPRADDRVSPGGVGVLRADTMGTPMHHSERAPVGPSPSPRAVQYESNTALVIYVIVKPVSGR